jgi:hypothetical protein
LSGRLLVVVVPLFLSLELDDVGRWFLSLFFFLVEVGTGAGRVAWGGGVASAVGSVWGDRTGCVMVVVSVRVVGALV